MTSPIVQTLRDAWASRSGRAGLITLGVAIACVLLLPSVLPDPNVQANILEGAVPPSLQHPFGTDQLNRDVLSRVVHGAGISFSVAFLSVALSITLGALAGLVAGYRGGWVDVILMRLVDGALAIPRLFILLLLLAITQHISLPLFIIVLGTTGWFGVSRIVRGEALRLRHAAFIQAAEALGAGGNRVIFRHLLPNTAGPLLVAATLGVGDVILLEAGLSFLGLGLRPPTPTLGGMIQESREIMVSGAWASLFPGLAIMVTVLAVNLLGEAIRDSLDPKNAAS